jgi:hypothetical protein
MVLIAAPVSVAVTNVYFSAINEELMPLTETAMPIVIGNKFYIPCDFFTTDELGVYYVSGTQIMLL